MINALNGAYFATQNPSGAHIFCIGLQDLGRGGAFVVSVLLDKHLLTHIVVYFTDELVDFAAHTCR